MGKHAQDVDVGDINLVPIMNLVCLLIPFLLLSASFMQYAVINVAAPRINSSAAQPPQEQDRQPLNLTLVITDQGFYFRAGQPLPGQQAQATTDATSQGAEITLDDCGGPDDPPRMTGRLLAERDRLQLGPEACRYNWARLRERIIEIKEQYNDDTQVIISAEPKTDYQVIIKAMDTTRCKVHRDTDVISANPPCGGQDNELFPDVVLAAGAG